jgi:hypothetical protein
MWDTAPQKSSECSGAISAVVKHLERLDAELQEARKAITVVGSIHQAEMKRATDLIKLQDVEIETLRRQLAIYKV